MAIAEYFDTTLNRYVAVTEAQGLPVSVIDDAGNDALRETTTDQRDLLALILLELQQMNQNLNLVLQIVQDDSSG